MPLDKNYIKAETDKAIVKNTGVPLQLDVINEARVNKSAVEKRCDTVTNRRTVKKHNQAAWLLKAITCMDLTTLSGDDTERRVIRLCNKAKTPLRHDLLKSLYRQRQCILNNLGLANQEEYDSNYQCHLHEPFPHYSTVLQKAFPRDGFQ